MKNNSLKITAVVIVAGAIAFTSCKKESMTNPTSAGITKAGSNLQMMGNSNNVNVTVTDKHLVFKTFSDYATVIDNYSAAQKEAFIKNVNSLGNFTSYAKNWANTHDSNAIDTSDLGNEPLLGAILNPQLVIQVDKFIFKFDTTNGTSYAISSAYSGEINDLISGNLKNPHVMAFYNEDNAIDLLQTGVLGTARNIGGSDRISGGSCPSAHHRKDWAGYILYGPLNIFHQHIYRDGPLLNYVTFPLYHHLYAYMNSQQRFFFFFWRALGHWLSFAGQYSYTIECQNSVGGALVINNSGSNFFNSWIQDDIWGPNTTPLSQFYVTAIFTDHNVPFTTVPYVIHYP